MTITFRTVRLTKLYPLAISRGVSTGSNNLFVFAEHEGHVGVGECAPGTGYDDTLADIATADLGGLLESLGFSREGDGFRRDGEPPAPHEVWAMAFARGVNPSAIAAIDVALWDLLAKRAGQPLYRVLGLPRPSVPTSVTIGINPPEVTRERVPDILRRTGGKCLKIKLGSPDGREFDKVHFEAAREAAAPFGVKLRVDANGGWTVDEAKMMLAWLAERGVDYCEQPLVEGNEDGLPAIFEGRPMPIYVDESCRLSSSVPKLAGRCDGVNLKLMKCGGITEALRIVAAARACGLGTMIGCMGESSVAIAGGAALGALFDHIDLDSQLNLNPDPASGLDMVDGIVMPRDVPGHGAELTC